MWTKNEQPRSTQPKGELFNKLQVTSEQLPGILDVASGQPESSVGVTARQS